MKYLYSAFLILTVLIFSACSQQAPSGKFQLKLTQQKSGTGALLVGVSAVNENVVWVTGTLGTILRTTNGGKTWKSRTISGTDSLQFRDVYAVSAQTAYVLSIGKGAKSRIYKTTDGGRSWTLQFKSSIPRAFFDCMAFWNAQTGIAFSDAVNGAFIIIKTTDGGKTWTRIPPERIPEAQPGEAGFAASGTCVTAQGDSTAWIGTGGAAQPRVLRTTDRGKTWKAFPVPLDAGQGAGVASLIFRDTQHGMAFGGDILKPATSDSTAAITNDGGRTWKLVKSALPGSPVYGAAYIPGTKNVVAVGPGGVAFSTNEGRSWTRVDTVDTWGISFANDTHGWLVGPNGRIVHVKVQ